MTFVRTIPWTTRPLGTVGLDRTNPMGQAVELAVLTGVDGITSLPSHPSAAPVIDIAPRRYDGAFFDTGSDPGIELYGDVTIQLTGAVSFYYRNIVSLTAINYFAVVETLVASQEFALNASGLIFRINGQSRNFDALSTDLADGEGHWVTVNYHNVGAGSYQRCYVDGVLEEELTANTFGAPRTGNQVFLGRNDSTFNKAKGVVNAFTMYNRNLTLNEIKSLCDNPWQIYAPRTHLIPIEEPAAGGGPTEQLLTMQGTYGMNTMAGGFKQ